MAKSSHFRQSYKHTASSFWHMSSIPEANRITRVLSYLFVQVMVSFPTPLFSHYQEQFYKTLLIIGADRPSVKLQLIPRKLYRIAI